MAKSSKTSLGAGRLTRSVLLAALALSGCKDKAPGPKELIWDGEAEHGGGKGWGKCDQLPGCQSEISVEPGKGYNASNALVFRGEGGGYIGAGWNWFGWWPGNAGTDFGPYDTLRFAMRLIVEEPKPPPEELGISVLLACSTGKQSGNPVKLKSFVEDDIADGRWHQVDIPLDEFYGGNFDLRKVWEIQFNTWLPTRRVFELFVDNVTVLEK